MTNEVGENFLLYRMTHEIWAAAKEFYSSVENTSITLEMKTTLHYLQQEDLCHTILQFSHLSLATRCV